MSDQVVTSLVIEADTGGANRYAEAMESAARSADKATFALNDLSASSKAANDILSKWQEVTTNTDKTAVSFHLTGIESLEMTNHLRQAAIAAYALSPAFREFANPVIAASIRATGTALSAMAPAAAAATGAMLSGISPLLATVGRVALPILVIKDAFDAMASVSELGAQKIKEFSDLANNASGAGVGAELFQRQTLGAKELGLEIGKATDGLKRFNDLSTERLGGSALDSRLSALSKAGNFQNNSGVAALAQATSVEEKYRAVALLITNAMDSGERLAALDLAEKFLPPELQTRLRANGDLLREMQEAAEAVKPVDLVSATDIGYALELKRRLSDANDIIENKFKPVQKDLTQLGLNYQESWVNIVEVMAGGVTKANDLYSALKGIPGLFAEAGNASFWDKLAKYGSRPDGLVLRGEPGFENTIDPARAALASGLNNPNAIQQAMLNATNVSYGVRRDQSVAPGSASNANDSLDRAIEQLEKHTARTEADTAAVGLGAGALAEFRAEASLTTAAQQAGVEVTQKMRDRFQDLAQDAGEAAMALEKAKIASQISFDRQTAFLTPTDVRIAQQLKGIYGNDIPAALASTEAAALRANETLRQLNDIGKDTVKGFVSDFTNSIRNGSSQWEAFESAGLNALNKIADKLTNMAIDNLWASAFGGSGSSGILGLLGIGGGGGGFAMSSGLGAGTGGLSFPMFADGTNSAPGGPAIVGEEGPEIVNLPRGATVTPNGQFRMAAANDNAPISIVYAPTINAPNSDAKAVAQLATVVAKDKRDFERNVTGIMAKHYANTPGSNRRF